MSRMLTAAVLGLTLLLGGRAAAAKVDPLLPDATVTVAFVNVRQMQDLPLAKPHAEPMLAFVLQLAPEARRALDGLGIRPLEDVDTLTVAVETAIRRNLIVHGKFDRARITEAAERLAKKSPERMKVLRDGDTVVYEQHIGRDTVYSAVVDEQTLLFSWSLDRVTAAAKGKARPAKLKPKMQELVAGMEEGRSVWVVFGEPRDLLDWVLKKLFNPLGVPLLIKPPLLTQLEKSVVRAKAVTCSVAIDREIVVAGSVRLEDREVAAALAEVLGETRALRLLVAANPLLGRERGEALAEVIAETRVKADKGDVSFQVKITDGQMRTLLRDAGK